MPKGVEHRSALQRAARATIVTPSVMPKGVEHTSCAIVTSRRASVTPSVMPKGVEHTCARAGAQAAGGGDALRDAEKALSTPPCSKTVQLGA